MKPLTNRTNHIPSPAYHGGFFINPTLPKKTCAGLTTELASSLTQKKIINKLAIVNKPVAKSSFTMNYKNTIYPTIKPTLAIVNKMSINRNPKMGSTVAHIYNRRHNRGIGCNMHPVSFSLLRFVPVPPVRERSNKRSDSLRQLGNNNERNKRNEEKLNGTTKSMLARITIVIPASPGLSTNPYLLSTNFRILLD